MKAVIPSDVDMKWYCLSSKKSSHVDYSKFLQPALLSLLSISSLYPLLHLEVGLSKPLPYALFSSLSIDGECFYFLLVDEKRTKFFLEICCFSKKKTSMPQCVVFTFKKYELLLEASSHRSQSYELWFFVPCCRSWGTFIFLINFVVEQCLLILARWDMKWSVNYWNLP